MQGPVLSVPKPHFSWGSPTDTQSQKLQEYMAKGGAMSIYSDDGVYAFVEEELRNIYGVDYCILTNTGTSALNAGYFGLGIQPGDEVIVPTYTFLATVTPLLRLGARIVFCDADPQTGNVCPLSLKRLITGKTKAVAITHMWGIPCDMDNIMPIIREHKLRLLEDCSHAHFTACKGRLVGTFGDVACFSTGAKKTMTCGEGGFLITSDPEVYLRATLLGHFDARSKAAIQKIRDKALVTLSGKYEQLITGFGENYRMHPYAAAMLYALLEEREIFQLIALRRESLIYFIDRLGEIPGISVAGYQGDYFTGAMYGLKPQITIRKTPLTAIVDELQKRNLEIKLPDTSFLHNLPIFAKHAQPFEGSNGYVAYLEGRISIPTFSNGLAKDRDLIDQYCSIIHYVLNKSI